MYAHNPYGSPPQYRNPQQAYYQPQNPGPPPLQHTSSIASRHSHTSSQGRRNHGSGQFQQGPPQGADPQLWQWFSAVDVDHSGSISPQELQSALVNGDWSKFDLDTVKMLMSTFDTDRSGTIGFAEFTGLWKYITDWQNVFRHFDRDRSGSIEGNELAEALRSFGYNLSPTLLSMVEIKYASASTTAYGPPPGITFDRFVRACVVVKTLTEAFQRVDTDRDGWIQINYEQFMKIVLSCP